MTHAPNDRLNQPVHYMGEKMTKKLYIYDQIDGLTTNYHDGGSLVIVTAGDPQEALDADRTAAYGKFGDKPFLTKLPEPDRVIEVADSTPEEVFEFPDSGCC